MTDLANMIVRLGMLAFLAGIVAVIVYIKS